MLNRFILVVVLAPIAVVLIALAVANRGAVPFTFDPFDPGNPALTIQAPLFIMLFVAFGLGMIVGSIATWLKQGRYRKMSRQRGLEAQAARDAAARKAKAPQPATGTALARSGS